jgi:hypothetical protein
MMTPEEKLVWAAAFAEHIGWHHSLPQNRREVAGEVHSADAANAAIYAHNVILAMRRAFKIDPDLAFLSHMTNGRG